MNNNWKHRSVRPQRLPAGAIGFVAVLSLAGWDGTAPHGFALGAKAMADTGNKEAELIVNGGFEEPVVPSGRWVLFNAGQSFPGWLVIGDRGNVAPISGQYAGSGIKFTAQDGAQWLDMTGVTNSVTGVQQTVRTQPDTIYHLTFFVGNVYHQAGGFGTTSSVEALVNGQSVGVFKNDGNVPGVQQWGMVSIPITPTSASTTIAFVNRDAPNDNSNGLDGVSFRPAPNVALRGSVSEPGPEQGWWQLQLDQPYSLDGITVWNKANSESAHSNPFTVTIFLGDTQVVSIPKNILPESNKLKLIPNGVVGDRVRIETENPEWLHLAEVAVYGRP
jgi:hypothetical protein